MEPLSLFQFENFYTHLSFCSLWWWHFTILEDLVKHHQSVYSSIIFSSVSIDKTVDYICNLGPYPNPRQELQRSTDFPGLSP